MICLWRRETTPSAVQALYDVTARLGTPSGMLTVVEANAALPNSQVRAAVANVLRDSARSVVCSALVFEGEGFRAAAVRAITTTISQLARAPFPHRVFGTVEEAARWLESIEPQLSAAKLCEDLRRLREALDEVAPL